MRCYFCGINYWVKEVIELKLKGEEKEKVCFLNFFLSNYINEGVGELRII